MPGITFSQEDIASVSELAAGWYPMIAKSIVAGPGKKDPNSTTWTCIFQVIDGPSKGVELQSWFSTKMMKNVIRYMKCFVQTVEPGKEYPIEETVNRPVQAYCVWDIENQNNVIKDFKPVGR